MIDQQDRRSATVVRWIAATAGALVIALGGLLAAFWAADRFVNLNSGHVKVNVPGLAGVPQEELNSDVFFAFAERVDLIVMQMPEEAATYFWYSTLLTAVCCAIAALTSVVLCYRLARGVPFGPVMQWTVAVTGLVAIIGGIGVAVLEGYGKFTTVHSVPGLMSVGSPIGTGSLDLYIADSINPLFFVGGLTLLLLAAVLSRGTRYYRDVRDLV